MEMNKILWPTDFSENAAKALPYVTSLSEKYGTEIHVLYVLEAWGQFGSWYGDYGDQKEIDRIQAWAKETAEKRLGELCENHLSGCPLYIRHIAVGEPAEEILKLIDQEKVDLVLMATHGDKARYDFGNVAGRVVKNAPVPVLTIPVSSSVKS
jgi:nucleotide-binding universal stress UspA family protein